MIDTNEEISLNSRMQRVRAVADEQASGAASKAPKSRRRQPQRGRRELVLTAAAGTLNRYGVSYASMPHLAQQLGVSRAALYYYVRDQRDLVFQSYRRTCDTLLAELSAAISIGGDAAATLEHFLASSLAADATEIAALSDLAYLAEPERMEIVSALNHVRSRLSTVLTAGSAAGVLRPCNASVIATAILGLLLWVRTTLLWRIEAAGRNSADVQNTLRSVVRLGIATDRAAVVLPPATRLPAPGPELSDIFDATAVAAAKHETLLSTASWLFNLKGVDATSLDEIAARLGVTKKVIYHNVGDKETLVVECYRRSFRFYESVARGLRQYDGTRLAALIAAMQTLAATNLREDLARLVPLSGIESLPASVRVEIEQSSARLRDMHSAEVMAGQAEGSIRGDVNAALVVGLTPGLYQWLPKWYETLSPAERACAPAEISQLYCLGLLPV